jgi:hypothetical protein
MDWIFFYLSHIVTFSLSIHNNLSFVWVCDTQKNLFEVVWYLNYSGGLKNYVKPIVKSIKIHIASGETNLLYIESKMKQNGGLWDFRNKIRIKVIIYFIYTMRFYVKNKWYVFHDIVDFSRANFQLDLDSDYDSLLKVSGNDNTTKSNR